MFAVGITLMYSPVSGMRIGRVGIECYGYYGFLIMFAGIAFLFLAFFNPSTVQNKQNGQNKQNEQR
jgi:hypothetical protein